MTLDSNNNESSALSSQSSEITNQSNSPSGNPIRDEKTMNNQSSPFLGLSKITILTVIGLATLVTILLFSGDFQACLFSNCGTDTGNGGGGGISGFLAVIIAIGSYILAITLGLTVIPAFLVSLVIWFITQIGL